MAKQLPATLTLLLLAGCGGGLESDLWEAEESRGGWSLELARRLCENASDPRVKEHLGNYIRGVAIRAKPGDSPDEVVTLIGQTLAKDPLPADPRNAEAIVQLIQKDVTPSAREWIKDYETDPEVTRALAEGIQDIALRGRDETQAEDINRLVAELEARKTPLDSGLLYLIVNAAVRVPKSAAAVYLKTGFPGYGVALGSEERTPPVGDERIRKALLEGVKYLDRPYRLPDVYAIGALAEAVRIHLRPSSEDADTYLKAVLPIANKHETYLDMTRIVVACAGDAADRVHRIAGTLSGGAKSYGLRVAETLGYGNADPGAVVLKAYQALLGKARNESERIRAGRKAEKQLIALEEKAVPALKLLLNDKNTKARSLAVRAWSTVDPGGLAAELNKKLQSPPNRPTWELAREAVPLLSKAQGPVVDEFLLRCLGLGGEPSTRSAQILGTRLDADRFTGGLFALLVRKESFSGPEIDLYLKTLASYAGIGAAVARHLRLHLEAAGGRPEKIYWMVKVLALRTLKARGDASAKPILEKIKADTSTFVWTEMRTNPQTGAVVSEEKQEITFSEEAEAALKAISGAKE